MRKSKGEVISILQSYKSTLISIIGGLPHLELKDGEIDYTAAEKGGGGGGDKIDRCSKHYGMQDQAKSIWKRNQIEKWLSNLTDRQKEAVYWRYINHDYEPGEIEDGYITFKGLHIKTYDAYCKETNNFKRIEGIDAKMGITANAVNKHLKLAIKKLQNIRTEIKHKQKK